MNLRIESFINHLRLVCRYNTINAIFTHLTPDEKITLLNLARSAEGIFIEIGSYYGSSSCFIAEGIQQSRKKSKLYCIDTWENHTMPEGKKETYDHFIINTQKYHDIITPLKGWSNEISKRFDMKFRLRPPYNKCIQFWTTPGGFIPNKP